MTTGYFFTLSGAGHVNPTLSVVTELIKRGERIVYYAHDEHCASIEATGAEFRSFPVAPPLYPVSGVDGTTHLAVYKMEQTIGALAPLLETLRADPPDYIMFDMMGALGLFLAKILNLPAICSSSSFAFTNEVLADLGIPPEAFIAALGGANFDEHLRDYEALCATIQQRYGIDTPDWLASINLTGGITLVYTSATMHPAADTLNDTIHLVGASIRPSIPVSDFPYEVLDVDNLIYISLGTEFNDQPQFYRDCLTAFADASYPIVLAVGHRISLDDLGEIPANFTVTRYAPQLEILPKARLFITHAGMNSVHEGLYHGVPLVTIPQMAEQGAVAGQVARNGAGIILEKETITPTVLREAVETVLADARFRENAQRVGDTLRAAGGAPRAAEIVLDYVEEWLGQREAV